MTYKKYHQTEAVQRDDGAIIFPGANGWDKYQEWVAEGGVTIPAEIPVPQAVTQVTMKQARLALAEFGALSKVKKALAELPEPQQTLATVAWECSPTVSKDDILIQTLATLTGLTAEDVDNLFELAATK